mmetsp:Transcript_61507/g.170545  ORF Transcript_61507/g.170545 Transcript_61507/m.170545 type:complete len:208 (-) Transcript_61507:147-770(-)
MASSSCRFSSICSAKRMASSRTADAAASGTPPRLASTSSSSRMRSPRTDASCMDSWTASSSSLMRRSLSLPSSIVASSSLMRFERSTAAWSVADTRASSSAMRAFCARCESSERLFRFCAWARSACWDASRNLAAHLSASAALPKLSVKEGESRGEMSTLVPLTAICAPESNTEISASPGALPMRSMSLTIMMRHGPAKGRGPLETH